MFRPFFYFVIASALVSSSCKSTQPVATPTEQSKPSRDVQEKYADLITQSTLKKHLTIVASDEMEGRLTGTAGIRRAGDYLIEQYKNAGIGYPPAADSYRQPVPAAYLNARRNLNLADCHNIWAFIPGSEKPEEIVVLSAHYDHEGVINGEVYNGADDDGSGTVALLTIAQAMQKAVKEGKGPKRSVLFLHVTAEEKGLIGSRYYTENPLYDLQQHIADLNIDMIGRSDDLHADNNKYVYAIGSDRLSTELHEILLNANQKYVNMDVDLRYNDRNDPNRFYFRSDHYNFAKNNIPSLFFFSGVHPDYHKPTDDVDKIEFDAYQIRTQLVFHVLWELVNRENKIAVDRDGK